MNEYLEYPKTTLFRWGQICSFYYALFYLFIDLNFD